MMFIFGANNLSRQNVERGQPPWAGRNRPSAGRLEGRLKQC